MRRFSASATALLVSLLVIPGSVISAWAQEAAPSHEEELGIIVTPTQEKAAEALKRLRSGWNFEVVAKEESTDPSAANGGYLGRLSPADLQPEFRDALKGVGPGQYSEIVRTPSGFAILKVLKIAPHPRQLEGQRIKAWAHSGVVRFGVDVGGIQQADRAFGEAPKPDGWNRNLQEICSIRKSSYTNAVAGTQRNLAAPRGQGMNASLNLLRDHIELGQLYAYQGRMPDAIAEYKTAAQIAQSDIPDAMPYFLESLGALYLHYSEMENGAYRDPGDEDIFPPLHPGRSFKKTEESQQAVVYLDKYLALKPDDMQARWLLNLAYDTLGKYPDGVPAAQLLSPSAFKSGENVGLFKDVAPAAGLNAFLNAGGLLVDDFENDGLLDVIVSSSDDCDPMHFYHNNGDGTFTDRTVQAGLSNQLGGLNMVEADYNNDGCMDVLVLRGGWQFPMRKSLLRNNCNGTFTDVTDASGLGKTVTATQSAVFADIDNDGLLDLFIANEKAPSQLFRNRGDGTFEDISHQAGIDRVAMSKGVTAADYDNDGYVDFYVSNYDGPNFLYRNNHDGTFSEIATQAGVQGPYFSFATWFFDYDNDGWPDLFVTADFNSIDESVRSYMKMPTHVETLKLYRNMHDGTFEDVTAKVGLDRVFMPMGANFGDFDNDGYEDIYMGMGAPSLGSLMPHVLMRNDAARQFVDVTASSGTGELHKGHSISFADLRRNGLVDILAETGGAIPSDKHTLRVFENPGNANDWINVRLQGVKTNRSGVGAKIHVTVENAGVPRSLWRTVGETSSFGSHPMEQHIGLGPKAKIISLDVIWPVSHTRQHFTNVAKDQFIAVKEFATEYTPLNRKPVPLGKDDASASQK
ncbi:MAG: FG-GAP-like repeat-containing protein [Terracidiphilus sp.]